jgi:hypothetical protein
MTGEPMDPEAEPEAWPDVRRRLAELAAAESRLEAPRRVEVALVEAFRDARARRGVFVVRPATSLPLFGRGLRALAAAAAVLIALAAVLAPESQPPNQELADLEDAGASFLPLVEGDPWDDLDAVQVVSVEVPRSALANLGWNGSPDAAAPVTAELLVGQDGLARGIRFVQ